MGWSESSDINAIENPGQTTAKIKRLYVSIVQIKNMYAKMLDHVQVLA